MPISFHSTPAISFFDKRGVSLLFPTRVFDWKPCFVAEYRWMWRPRLFASLEVNRVFRRKCSPILEANLLSNAKPLDSNEWRVVPDIWKSTAEKYGHRKALVDLYHDPPTERTYKQLEQDILDFSEGLRVVGLLPEEKIALFADNSSRWLVADQGTMATGAINVVRGTRSSNDELVKIYNHSDSIALVVDNPEFFNKLAESLIPRANIRFVILLWGDKSFLNSNYAKDIPLYDFEEIIGLGHESRLSLLSSCKKGEFHTFETIEPDDIATLMYTSGSSGTPKGVMLSHRNFLHQIMNFGVIVPTVPGDRFLSMLPSWHAYERVVEYVTFTYGIEQVYTNVKKLKDDLKQYSPQYLISVPLVYEILYSSIKNQLSSSSAARKFVALSLIRISLLYMDAKRIYEGKVLTMTKNQQSPAVALFYNLWGRVVAAILWPFHILGMKLVYNKIHSAIGISKAGISGGGSLPLHIDKFFEAIGVKLQNGYGLTETSPIVACRSPYNNVLGTVGHPLNFTEIMIVDLTTGRSLPDGSKGIVKVRGPQIMKGYYKMNKWLLFVVMELHSSLVELGKTLFAHVVDNSQVETMFVFSSSYKKHRDGTMDPPPENTVSAIDEKLDVPAEQPTLSNPIENNNELLPTPTDNQENFAAPHLQEVSGVEVTSLTSHTC
ncbi:long-chain-fatty-acid--[acyl-carrier-protein] ligase AEE15, chloroplastic-like [Phalaenopsis equestris]|uniref:long-chain-fatty-acid--[acyl-carrier-protein] ligase AEE15, chloroplastic-like n=1 Tax=Phalaenopsis equestris TaxID=78828 RepID=UPI0009E5CEAA|nr:long-chain-fatty-acid--[acyl-carrier-protein] ligase AEE15, chloroplastic-like [Phalaenopsis equestris]